MENIHYTTMMVDGDVTNWREKTQALVEGEPVEFRLKDATKRYPIVQISSQDKSALSRVLDKAINQ